MCALGSGEPERQFQLARERLVRSMVEQRIIRSSAIERAFLSIPRESFVPCTTPSEAYADTTIPISSQRGEWLTTSSQPTMMAIMLEQLEVERGHRVLEIGAGTGYNAALLAHLVGSEGAVDSVEIDSEAAAKAGKALAALGSTARAHQGDGADGWPEAAPYDRIIATVSMHDVPSSWDEQATANARIVVPICVLGGDYSTAFHREGDDWVSDSVEPCAFVRFRGKMSVREAKLTLGDPDTPALSLAAETGQLPRPSDVTAWLDAGVGESVRSLGGRSEWDGFVLWLVTRRSGKRVFRASSGGRGLGWMGPAAGIWDEEGMAMITPAGRLECFGGGESSKTLQAIVAIWRAAGSPDLTDLRLRLRIGQVDAPNWLPRQTCSFTVERY